MAMYSSIVRFGGPGGGGEGENTNGSLFKALLRARVVFFIYCYGLFFMFFFGGIPVWWVWHLKFEEGAIFRPVPVV